jgi:competence protein ComEA
MKRQKFVIPVLIVVLVALLNVFTVVAGDSKININTASSEELAQLKGIGPSYAAKIIEYREKNGPFKTPEDLMQVQGIGQKIFDTNKELITVE